MLHVHIEEDHNEVLRHIYRQIGAKKLPFSDLTLVHLDSHPDLLSPKDLQAKDVFDKDVLFSKLTIENWVLPAVYAGHLSTIIWIKPPWSEQVPDGVYNFKVGEDKQSGRIKLSCPENYFLGELLYASEDDLSNAKPCTLHVLTLGQCLMSGQQDDDEEYTPKKKCSKVTNMENKTGDSCEQAHCDNTPDVTGIPQCRRISSADGDSNKTTHVYEQVTKLNQKLNNVDDAIKVPDPDMKTVQALKEIIGSVNNPYILDFDLDFFSTRDPFREIYSAKQYHLLRLLYRFRRPANKTQTAITSCLENRKCQIAELGDAFHHLQEGNVVDFSQMKCGPILEELVNDLQQAGGHANTTDYLWLHEIGTGIDDTELPHHISSDEQIKQLVSSVYYMLSELPCPAVVTISRSSDDDYCPKHQVESIQKQVLSVVEMYGEIDIHKHYLDK